MLPVEYAMANPPAKNSMRALTFFSFIPDSFIAVRHFFAKSWINCREGASPAFATVGNRRGCPTVHRFLNETFPKNSQIYHAADIPARLAQSTTLDFSRSASTDAGENR